MNNPELNHIIFCYGSNMCEYEMLKYSNRLKNNKTNHFELLDIGVLDNYKFVYRNICLPTSNPKIKSSKATIIPNKKTCVYGTIVKLSNELFNLIVKKEGIHKNYYIMKMLKIKSLISNTTYDATVFIMNKNVSSNQCNLNISKYPSKKYENKIVKSAQFYNFPQTYINKYLISK